MKQIDNSLTSITNVLFRNRKDYEYLTNKQKTDNFFIIRRYISKSEPELMLKINSKLIDPVIGMDIIFYHYMNNPLPNLWSKSSYKKEPIKYSKDEILLMEKLDVSYEELILLRKYFSERLDEELNYFKLLEKDKKKK